jgi:hypothetical protein
MNSRAEFSTSGSSLHLITDWSVITAKTQPVGQ